MRTSLVVIAFVLAAGLTTAASSASQATRPTRADAVTVLAVEGMT